MTWILAIGLVIAFAGILYQIVGTIRDARRIPPPGRLIDIGGGRRLHLHCRGAGTPAVIFDSGIAASSLTWSRVQPPVAEFTRACSYDRAGLAWSDAARPPISALHLASQLRALLTAAEIPPPYVLVGHSFGSFVVRAFAGSHPGDVAGLVLVDPIYPSEWMNVTREQQMRLSGGVFLSRVGATLAHMGAVRACLNLLTRGSTGVPRRASRMFGSEAANLMVRMVGEVQKLPPEVWPAVQAHWSQPKSFRSMARHLSSLTLSAAEIQACGEHRVDFPIIVLSAATQPAACLAEHARIAAFSTRGRHVVARGSGHWVHLDEADLVVEAIREIVDSFRREHAATG